MLEPRPAREEGCLGPGPGARAAPALGTCLAAECRAHLEAAGFLSRPWNICSSFHAPRRPDPCVWQPTDGERRGGGVWGEGS